MQTGRDVKMSQLDSLAAGIDGAEDRVEFPIVDFALACRSVSN